MMVKNFFLFWFLTILSVSNCDIVLQLDSTHPGRNWTVSNSNGSISIPAYVPGGIYSDLQAAGIVNRNLFYRFNDIEYRWVGKENWTYELKFDVAQNIADKSEVNLVFEGLDTMGDVFLNDILISSFDNMFVKYVFEVSEALKVGENVLRIKFAAPVPAALAKHEQQSKSYPIPPYCDVNNYQTECHVNYLRKMQASFSWDWGPAFPSVGCWKSVYLSAFDGVTIEDVTVDTNFNTTSRIWLLNVTSYLHAAPNNQGGDLEASLTLNSINGKVKKLLSTVKRFSKIPYAPNVTATFVFILPEEDVELWWPNGYGQQTRSEFTLSFISNISNEISIKKVSFGFRTVELIQDVVVPGKEGRHFYFLVNNVPVFAKGSNWIPGHVLPERGYEESRIRHYLTSAKDVHTNMIRVWGGGVYESDIFYEIADELGILIWQDFMFAVALYPTDEKYLSSVRQEVEHQVKRIQHHPCIAVWAGNNENEAGLTGNWWGPLSNYTIYYNDYVKLYVDTIQPVLTKYDPGRPYVVSSPSNGIKSVEDGYVSKDPYSPLYGDTHYYNYLSDGWNSNNFPDTRFASEYGYQSLPSYKTLAKVSLPQDRYINSNFSKSRQHHPLGYTEITGLIRQHLPLPEDDESDQFYQTYIYYSQISQAMSLKTETEKYRTDRNKHVEDSDNRVIGHNMGALYWQLNDVWEAPTWASIDFYGNWKLVHYYAKNFFAPVLVSLQRTLDHNLDIYLVSDVMEDVQIQVNLTVYSFNSLEPKQVISNNYTARNLSALAVGKFNIKETLTSAGCATEGSCFFYVTASQKLSPDNYLFLAPLTNASGLEPPKNFTITSKQLSSKEAEINLSTDRITPFVWLETDVPGQFSENGFIMVSKEKRITFESNNDFDYDMFYNSLTVRSLLTVHK